MVNTKNISQPHVMVTCYDATFSRLIGSVPHIDSLLVGDSLGMVIGGESNTLSVTLDDIRYHLKAVVRGLSQVSQQVSHRPTIVADMPVGTYDDPDQALANAQSLIAAGADMVKVEGPVSHVIKKLREYGIRVCGHIGLTPQSILEFKVQGTSDSDASRLIEEAQLLDRSGIEWLVLEMIPAPLAATISKAVQALTIGIGAGAECDGQVLVLYDLLGFNPQFNPRFLKKYLNGADLVVSALSQYSQEVRERKFPGVEHQFGLKKDSVKK